MSDVRDEPQPSADPPRAKIRHPRRKFSWIWAVPVVAAVLAGWMVYRHMTQFGPEIRIRFPDATGLRPGQTTVTHRGVTIGEVTGVELAEDHRAAVVRCRLLTGASSLAREGTLFWIVRPELSMGGIRGLGTIVSGPHIELFPGEGPRAKEFVGLASASVVSTRAGLNLLLLATERGSIKSGSPIYYRGIEVGVVRDCELSTNAITVDIHAFIEPRFTNLVRTDSRFWNVSGVDVRFGLFRGAEINVESLRSLAAGGISFATPPGTNAGPVTNGSVFQLHDEAQDEWLEWRPAMYVPREPEVLTR